MKDIVIKAIDSHSQELIDLSKKIWENPEIGWKEIKAVNWFADVLNNNGFTTEVGAYHMPTCIRASWGSGKPVVGFCAEYDCLPGLSQKICSYQNPVTINGNGHGCGHNLLGVGCLGACIGLKALMEEMKIPGTIVFYGCPAEEQLTGKGFMAKNGAFTECDFTYAWHPSNKSHDSYGIQTSVEAAIFRFHGRTSHAASAPQNGRSALDGLQLMNIGVEFLREHVTSDVRMHYTILEGGLAPNIVPDSASSKYFVRALTRQGAVNAFQRVIKCAQGAATMTDTTVEIERIGGLYPTLQNTILGDAVQQARKEIPTLQFSEEELKFADEINQKSPDYQPGKTLPLDYENQQPTFENSFGSTDYGDVQYICPGFQVHECTENSLAPLHSWMVTACVGSSIGQKGMLRAAKLMALAAGKILSDPFKLQAAKEEFQKSLNGSCYHCPIDDTVQWPYQD